MALTKVTGEGVGTLTSDLTITDKIIHDGDTNTAIRFPSADTVSFETGGSERARVTGDGVLLVGQTSFAYGSVGCSMTSSGQLGGTADGDSSLILNRTSSDGTIAQFRKDNTVKGIIGVDGSSNTYFACQRGAGIAVSDQELIPTNAGGALTDNFMDVGHPSYRFDDIRATNGTIQTSDRNDKQDIEELTDAETRVAVVAKGLMRKFRWKSAVAEKGDNARTHFGIIAQDLQDAFTAEGLDAGDYAMFISDTWTNDDGSEQTRLGVRYSELLAFIISAI